MQLLQNVTSTVNEVCKRLKSEEKPREIKPGRVVPCSVAAVKNGRRKMEDRHVVIHDVNIIFEDSSKEVSKDRKNNVIFLNSQLSSAAFFIIFFGTLASWDNCILFIQLGVVIS